MASADCDRTGIDLDQIRFLALKSQFTSAYRLGLNLRQPISPGVFFSQVGHSLCMLWCEPASVSSEGQITHAKFFPIIPMSPTLLDLDPRSLSTF